MTRVYLKPLKINNINKNYLSWFTEDLEYIEFSRNKINIETLRLYFNKVIKSKKKYIFLGIFTENKKVHIGNIKFEESNIKNKFYMGILIGNKKYTNKGLSKYIIKEAEKIFRKIFFLNKYYLIVDKKNEQAIKAYKKNKFKIYKKNHKTYEMIKII